MKKHTIAIAIVCGLAASTLNAGSVYVPTADGPDLKAKPSGIRSYGASVERVDHPTFDSSDAGSIAMRAPGMSVRISGIPMAGSVSAFGLTPDGATAVYIADQDTAGIPELYSVPVDGSSAPTKLSAGLTFGPGDVGVVVVQITADGAHAIFMADPNLGAGNYDAFSVPVDGSAGPTRLNTAAQAPVIAVGVARDGTTVGFFGPDTSTGTAATEVYRASVGVAGSGVQLSDVGASNPSGSVAAADFSPDSATLLYAADEASTGTYQWHSVPFSAVGPGSDVQLTAAMGSVALGRITADSSTLVYTGDETTLGVTEIFSVPLAGGSSTKLNPAMAGSGVTVISLAADSQGVAYLADQINSGVVEAFGAQVGAAASGVRLNSPLGGTQGVTVVGVAPDSSTVLYQADEAVSGTFDLMSAPIDASAGPNTLEGLAPPANVGSFVGLGIPFVAGRAIYPVIDSDVDLYSVPFDGSASSIRVNDLLAAGDSVVAAFVPNQGTTLMAYSVGATGVGEELFAGPVSSDFNPEQANNTATAGSLGVLGFEVTSDEAYVVYIQDQDTQGKPELYSRELDSDQDTVGNATDNCPFVSNPGQGAVYFADTVSAVSKTTFSWGGVQDVRYARGPLAAVSTLTTDATGTLYEAASLIDGDTPGAGAGFFYLFAVDCDGRSYQSAAGAEPARDAAGLP